MRARVVVHLAFAATLTAAITAACSGSGTGPTGSTSGMGGGEDAGVDAPAATTLRIEPDMASATVTLGTPPPAVTFHAFAKAGGGTEQDVTGQVDWSTAPGIAGISGGVASLTGNGGKATVTATLGGATATASLTVLVKGDVFAAGTDTTTKQGFDLAKLASGTDDPSAAPFFIPGQTLAAQYVSSSGRRRSSSRRSDRPAPASPRPGSANADGAGAHRPT